MNKSDKIMRSVKQSTSLAQADLLTAGSAENYSATMTILAEPI
jgi:hypothetical protein